MHDTIAEPARRGRTRLSGGRMLGWSEWGPASGAPVLFCPGAGMSSFLGFGSDIVTSLGVRLIGLDRPGLGASDPDPQRTLTSFADDVRELVRVRELDAPRMVAFSQGAPFALACAASGSVTGVAIVSGSDELARSRDALVPDVRNLVELAASDPERAEALFRTMTAEAMHGMVVAMSSEVDRVVYGQAAFDAAYKKALDEGFAQGADGYARDTLLAMSRWPFDVARISVPVELWYGREDTSPVHSPDLGASLAERIPGARRTVHEGVGGAILWTHAREILASLLSR